MKKEGNPLLILLLVLGALLVVYAGVVVIGKNQEKSKKKEEEAKKIYVTDLGKLSEIQFDVGNGEIQLVKEDGTWYDKNDKDFPLAQSYPKKMEKTFRKLEAERKLEDGDSLEAYGLEDPAYTVVLTDQDGNETTLYFGNVTGDSYYLTLNEKKEIYTVSTDVIEDFQYSMEDMAQLDTFPTIGSGNLKKVVISQGTEKTEYSSEKTEYSSENDDDAKSMATIAGGLGVLTLKDAADYSVEESDLSKYGLDEQSRTTETVTYTNNKKEKTVTLYFGKEDGNGNRYVMLSDSKIVYLVEKEKCKNMLNQDTES